MRRQWETIPIWLERELQNLCPNANLEKAVRYIFERARHDEMCAIIAYLIEQNIMMQHELAKIRAVVQTLKIEIEEMMEEEE